METGELAPDFSLPREDGSILTLSEELAKGPVVLFFYPKAMTTGCTRESCHFRDLSEDFALMGAQCIGISADAVDKQKAFSDRYSFDYPLVSDPDRKVAAAFGVKRPGPLFNRRMTFVIDTDRRVLAAISSELNMNTHADEALKVLRNRPD